MCCKCFVCRVYMRCFGENASCASMSGVFEESVCVCQVF